MYMITYGLCLNLVATVPQWGYKLWVLVMYEAFGTQSTSAVTIRTVVQTRIPRGESHTIPRVHDYGRSVRSMKEQVL